MQILETARLILRPFEETDLDAFAPICGDPEVMRYYRAPWSRETAATFIRNHSARQAARGYSLWAVIHKEDERLIGFCGLVEQQVEGVEEIELGYLLDKRYWRRGLATEAARACRDYAFGSLGLPRLVSLIHPENAPSIRVAEKNGMRDEREAAFNGRAYRVYAIEKQAT